MSILLQVLYEDNHLLAINKATGTLVQGDSTGDVPLVELGKDYLKHKYHKPGAVFLGVVHRLDRPVSGVVVFARTSKALARMNELFREKETRKTYWALVETKPAQTTGTLVHWLVKDEQKNKTTAYVKPRADGLKSELSYTLIASKGGLHLLEVNPVTGRPHQIRVQLASMGCTIVGDVKYGYKQPLPDASIALHARQLEFIHPVQKSILVIKASLPEVSWWNPFRDL
ncbi:MAG: RluA family pseudouridine synthase [Cyclobacteriaceae bacterium]|nr:MAG: RluA family pseudouridine synthase [Cyclobacteriaceae bacterium]